MTSSVPSSVPGLPVQSRRRFATTRWSLIREAGNGTDVTARAALEELCQAYWLPVYGFMRRQTRDVHEAQDWTQGFFASLLSHDAFTSVDPSRGRFRSFLLAAAKHFVANEVDRRSAKKRGGHVVLRSLDYEAGERQLAEELTHEQSPETLFERRWAVVLLHRVLDRLRQEYTAAGRIAVFDALAEQLSGTATRESLASAAEPLGMSPEAVRVAMHRLRKRYRRLLRDEIAQTTNSADDIDDEIRQLFRVFGS